MWYFYRLKLFFECLNIFFDLAHILIQKINVLGVFSGKSLIFCHSFLEFLNLGAQIINQGLIIGIRVLIGVILIDFFLVVDHLGILLDLVAELIYQIFEARQAIQLSWVFVDVGFEIFEAVSDDGKVVEEKVLVEETVKFDGDSVLKGDLGEFIHMLNIFIRVLILLITVSSLW